MWRRKEECTCLKSETLSTEEMQVQMSGANEIKPIEIVGQEFRHLSIMQLIWLFCKHGQLVLTQQVAYRFQAVHFCILLHLSPQA